MKIKSSIFSTLGPLGSAVTVGLCPVCIPAIGAFLSALGLGFMINETVLKPLLIALLLVNLGGLLWSYFKEHRNILPVVVGVLTGISLYVGRYVYFGVTANMVLIYGGILGIIGVSIWNLKLKKHSRCKTCEVKEDS